jgi:cellulose synthase/poly-beta-1,6-N-acetylglucosamine synthase-like glycosyltransferase
MGVAFWIALLGLGLPAYAYVGYPFLLFGVGSVVQVGRDLLYLLRRQDRRSVARREWSVSVIIAAFNEEDVIGHTLDHCTTLDYPADRLEILVGSDGSTDGTVAVAERYRDAGVRVLDFDQRRGKVSVISDCVRRAQGDIFAFTDANSLLQPDSVSKLVRHFDDSRVGAVCGELRLNGQGGRPVREGLYWRYELVLKTLESRTNAVLGANGAIYAVRRRLFPQLPATIITDDFVIPMKVRGMGYRVVYDPEAIALEESCESPSVEYRRRRRIGAGNWQALRQCAGLLAPWRGFVSVAFWSHKVFRWFTPFLLAVGFCANLFLLSEPIWQVLMAGQLAFYASAVLGLGLGWVGLPAGLLRLPAYFVAINAALAVGMVRGLLGVQRAAWERTARKPAGQEENR